jgi:hypothetical protein
MSKEIECKECGIEFNPNIPYHKTVGYFNTCRECAEELGLNQDKRVKAITHVNSAGDFVGIQVVSKDEYNKHKESEQETGKILSGR